MLFFCLNESFDLKVVGVDLSDEVAIGLFDLGNESVELDLDE